MPEKKVWVTVKSKIYLIFMDFFFIKQEYLCLYALSFINLETSRMPENFFWVAMKSKCTYLWIFFFFHQTGSGLKKKSQSILRCIEQKRSLVNQVAEIVCTLEKYNQTEKGLSKIFYLFKSEKVTSAKCLKNKIQNPHCFSKIKMRAGQPITHMRRHLTNSHDPMSQTIPQRQNKVPSYNFILVSLHTITTGKERLIASSVSCRHYIWIKMVII